MTVFKAEDFVYHNNGADSHGGGNGFYIETVDQENETAKPWDSERQIPFAQLRLINEDEGGFGTKA
jgi:hypothetical protein